jgi:hypothetical protein
MTLFLDAGVIIYWVESNEPFYNPFSEENIFLC